MARAALKILLALTLAMGAAAEPAQAVPYACLKQQAGDDLPFTAQMMAAHSVGNGDSGKTGSHHRLEELITVKAEAFASPLLADIPGLMESLEACRLFLKEEYSQDGAEERRLLALAMLAGARLRTARAAGDETGARAAAATIGRVRRELDECCPSLGRDDNLRLFTVETEASRAIEAAGPSDNAAVLALVRAEMSKLMRPGAAPDSPFGKYLDAVNRPLREALRLLSEAKVQRERAIALTRRVLSQGPEGAGVEGGAAGALAGGETALYNSAIEAWAKAAKPDEGTVAPIEPDESSYTRLLDRRQSLAELAEELKLDVEAREALAGLCVYHSDAQAADAGACLLIDIDAAADPAAINTFDTRYPDPPLDHVAPLSEMDAALASLAEKLREALDGMTLHDEDRTLGREGGGGATQRERAKAILTAIAADRGEDRRPALISSDWSREGSDTFLDLSPAITERELRDVGLPACTDAASWRDSVARIEGPRHKSLVELRADLTAPVGEAEDRRIPADADFPAQCGMAAVYLRGDGAEQENPN